VHLRKNAGSSTEQSWIRKQQDEVKYLTPIKQALCKACRKAEFTEHSAITMPTKGHKIRQKFTFKSGHRYVRDQSVQLVGWIFVFISLPCQANTHTMRNMPEPTHNTGSSVTVSSLTQPSCMITRCTVKETRGLIYKIAAWLNLPAWSRAAQ